MKKKMSIISILCALFLLFSFSVCFAEDDSPNEETVIKNIASDIIHYISWFAMAIALGALIFVGIKYVTSTANQKANLKGAFPLYMIGIIVIVFALVIVKFVVNIAGNNNAESIVKVGERAGDTKEITSYVYQHEEDEEEEDVEEEDVEPQKEVEKKEATGASKVGLSLLERLGIIRKTEDQDDNKSSSSGGKF